MSGVGGGYMQRGGVRRSHVTIAVVVLVLFLTIIWDRSHQAPVTPLTMPSSFLGLPFTRSAEVADAATREAVGKQLGDAPYAAAQYAEAASSTAAGQVPLVVNVVAARTDMTGKVDEALATGEAQLAGDVSCTTEMKVTGRLLCWRNGDVLSVSAMSISGAVNSADLAAAVDRLWAGLSTRT